MKAKAYLLKHGRIKEVGRGRISLDNVAFLKSAIDNGEKFSDWPKGKFEETTNSTGATEVRVVDREAGNEKVISELMPYRYTEDLYQAYEYVDGKKVNRSLREACNSCRLSLVVCYCPNPQIVARNGGGSVKVYIERK